MGDIIRLLPDSVANQIAAGEVIQRPAAVIKELVENAVDAGATDIRIQVVDAGKTMIQVIDDGTGMSETDARMAFERHATSKIRSAEDLFHLNTMGFRGEALPSICSISEVDLRTRTADAPTGTRLLIEGSKVLSQEPVMCDKGTVFTVKRLFYNIPARRKFLKSDSVELANIMREFERLALVNNTIRMRLDTGTRQIDLRPGNMKQRISEIWKNNLDMHLLPVNVDTSLIKIEGFISRPEAARRKNPLQFFFVNGRHMVHPYFRKAVLSCFENLIATDTQPNYFLKFTVDPNSIDVNIHPTKHEIKFEYEQQIWPILTAAIKAALGKFSAVPSIDFDADALDVRPARAGERVEAPESGSTHDYNPFAPAAVSDFMPSINSGSFKAERPQKNWESLYDSFRREAHKENSGFFGGREGTRFKSSASSGDVADSVKGSGVAVFPGSKGLQNGDVSGGVSLSGIKSIGETGESESVSIECNDMEEFPVASPDLFGGDVTGKAMCLQFAGRYIIAPAREGLMVIDQHRAHLRILYEEYIGKVREARVVSQGILFPEPITLDEQQRSAIDEAGDDLRRLGFELEYDEGDTWRLMAVPAMIGETDAKEIVIRLLDSVTEDSVKFGSRSSEGLNAVEKMALTMARATAIRRGTPLSVAEMEHILASLLSLPDPAYTPNGNPIFCILKESTLDHQFER